LAGQLKLDTPTHFAKPYMHPTIGQSSRWLHHSIDSLPNILDMTKSLLYELPFALMHIQKVLLLQPHDASCQHSVPRVAIVLLFGKTTTKSGLSVHIGGFG
jgi:hypothetical protein